MIELIQKLKTKKADGWFITSDDLTDLLMEAYNSENEWAKKMIEALQQNIALLEENRRLTDIACEYKELASKLVK
jgi:hypothetical protein